MVRPDASVVATDIDLLWMCAPESTGAGTAHADGTSSMWRMLRWICRPRL